ncbi:MAG: hypothetical protein JWO55_120 [Candidatus Saccharibacteria bacterium]|jgi:hypothetical protein|nr:hypothetical protein [Candidatus Saccharibacteria bacterium]
MEKELVSHKNNHVEDIQEFINSNERLVDPTQRRDYFGQLDGSEFIDLIQQTASLVRTGNASERQSFDGARVGLMGHEVPDQREKELLLLETWQVAKEYLGNNEISDQDALDYTALTVAGGLLYAHPFADGNGRTSRAVSYIISQGAENSHELEGILAKTGGGNWSVAPEALIMTARTDFTGSQPDYIEWDDALAGEGDDALNGIIANSVYKNRILRRMIEEGGEEIKSKIEDNLTVTNDGNTTLKAEKFIDELVNDSESGFLYANTLITLQREERADYVHRFLAAMKSREPMQPGKIVDHAEKAKSWGNERGIRFNAIVKKEMGIRAIDGLVMPIDRQLIRHKAYSNVRHELPKESEKTPN